MPIPLRLTTDGRIMVDGYISSKVYDVRGTVAFILDTGSQKTALGSRDAGALGFPVDSFSPYDGGPVFGIGGRAGTFTVGPCEIVLGDADLVADEDVLYFAPEREVRHRTRGGGRHEARERMFALPSILGTDILMRNECSLHVDWRTRSGAILAG